jgi:hypothetical protein
MVVFKQGGIEDIITNKQRERLQEDAEKWHGIWVYHGAYGLPAGYLSITLDPNGHPVYGGISPEGEIST